MARVDPIRATGEQFLESDLVLKIEMLAEPNIPTDYSVNQNTQSLLNFLRRMMEDFIGLVRIQGWEVTHVPDPPGTGTGSLQVSAGEILVKNYYINKAAVTVFDPAPSTGTHVLWLKLFSQRITFDSTPSTNPLSLDGEEVVGVTVPGTSLRLPGSNQYRAVYELQLGPELPGALSGVGQDGKFTRGASEDLPQWAAGELVGREVEVYDNDGNLLGPFVVKSNTISECEFEGDATGGTTIRDALYIKLADIEMTSGIVGDLGVTEADIVNSIPVLPGFVANLIHQQNTDTHTGASAFFVGGAPGASGAKRVLLEGEIEFEGRVFFQNIVEHSIPDATTRYYAPAPFNDSPATQAVESTARGVIPIDCEIKFLAVKMPTTVSVGGSVTITLYKNGSPTELTCVIQPGENFCQNVENVIEFLPLDTYSWEIINADGVSAHNVRLGYVIEITAETVQAVQAQTDFEIQTFSAPQVPNNFGGSIIPE